MSVRDPLRVLEDAHGDPALLALATVDLTFPELSDSARALLRTSLEAAAVPHWWNGAILARLLEIDVQEASSAWAELLQLPVVELFPARGSAAGNVHNNTRL